jgi:RNA polymerase sigma factor (TIGR02999 family)
MPTSTKLTGGPGAMPAEQLLPLVYEELRLLAASKLGQENKGQTLQATALVHEAYLRLIDGPQRWDSKGHFFDAAATAMRRILIENARRKRSNKHGGNCDRVDIANLSIGGASDDDELVDLDDALSRLAELDPQVAQIAEVRIFAGLTIRQTAGTLQIPSTSTFREWIFARAWLKSQVEGLDPVVD